MPRDRARTVKLSEDEEALILQAVRQGGWRGLSTLCREASLAEARQSLNPCGILVRRSIVAFRRDINRATATFQRLFLRGGDAAPEQVSQALERALQTIEDMTNQLESTIQELQRLKKT